MSYRLQILHGSLYGQSEQNTEVNKYKKYKKSTKVLITQPFFELQTPDFAWKFIWTVQPNDKVQKYLTVPTIPFFPYTSNASLEGSNWISTLQN